ncbi:MAG: hypothetical protein V4463_23565 [Pseudomonadota bacterium]
MRRLAFFALAALAAAHAGAAPKPHQFGVIGNTVAAGDEAPLRQAIADTSDANLGFVVATGIKGHKEPCSDALYKSRREMFDDAPRPVIVSLAAGDWAECRNSAGRLAAIERLNRIRELYFGDANSLGQHKLAVTRLSSTAKFRSYAENAHWEMGNVLYATINLPSNNNDYRVEAGRNSEYEDRLVANRSWLHRLWALAQRKKFDAIVLFSDGDVNSVGGKRDGFAEPRKQIATIAQKFSGKVLLVDSAASAGEPAITWQGKLGHLSVGTNAVEVRVTPGAAGAFQVTWARPGTFRSAEGA